MKLTHGRRPFKGWRMWYSGGYVAVPHKNWFTVLIPGYGWRLYWEKEVPYV